MAILRLNVSSVEELMLKEVMKHKKIYDRSKAIVALIKKEYEQINKN